MSLSRRHLAILAAAAVGFGVGANMLKRATARPPGPDVQYTVLSGQTFSNADLKGQVVLVNFWATSCSSCVAEMPHIAQTFTKFKDRGYNTIAVAMRYDPPAYVADFAERSQLPFGVAIDNTGAIAKGFGNVQLTPTSVLLDKNGAIVKRYVGPPDFDALHALIERLLAEA